MKKYDVVRSRYGSLLLWRVDEVYGSCSSFFLATLITTYKNRKAGSEQRMLRKEDYEVECDPYTFAARYAEAITLSPKLLRGV